MNLFNLFKRKNPDEDEAPRIITDIPNFGVRESYKAIRANINFAVSKAGCKKIMICSSFSGEGKTTTCVNLAITVAETGEQVLLIDCDLRRSRVHKFFNLENELGLSNFLSNSAELEDIVQETHIPNLSIISAGGVPPNPAELLTKPKMESLLNAMSKLADYIFIDTPPVCVVSDALPLSKKCDGVILVVKHMGTTHPSIKESLEKLKFSGANVVGMILNGIKIEKSYKMYGKYGKYSKYSKNSEYNKYGDDQGKPITDKKQIVDVTSEPTVEIIPESIEEDIVEVVQENEIKEESDFVAENDSIEEINIEESLDNIDEITPEPIFDDAANEEFSDDSIESIGEMLENDVIEVIEEATKTIIERNSEDDSDGTTEIN